MNQGKAVVVSCAIVATVGSADFSKRYATYRGDQKPHAPGPRKTGDQMQAEQRKAMAEAIANARKMGAQRPSMKGEMDALVKQLQAQMAQMAKDDEARARIDRVATQMGEAELAEHRSKVAEWEERYPADHRLLVAHGPSRPGRCDRPIHRLL